MEQHFSWRKHLPPADKHNLTSPKYYNFGSGHGIVLGLRFGHPTANSVDDDGEPSQIWSPVSKIVMEGNSKYLDLLREFEPSKSLIEAHSTFETEFIQIDNREWSLVFRWMKPISNESAEDFADFLCNYYLPENLARFPIWLDKNTGPDGYEQTRLGVWAKTYLVEDSFAWSEFGETYPRETPIMHFSDGSIEQLKRRSTALCPICEKTGNVWVSRKIAEAIDNNSYSGSDPINLKSLLSPFDFITYCTGIHIWCLKSKLKSDEITEYVRKTQNLTRVYDA